MPASAYEFLASLTYPLYASIWLIVLGAIALVLRWRKTATGLVTLALGWSLLWSIPQFSDWLRASLERRYPVVAEETLPTADAIVVLGGGSRYTWLERGQTDPEQLTSSRIAAGARAWLAGKARLIILSGGRGGPHASEAERMAEAIERLGIPRTVLLLEENSRNTRDNALNTARVAQQRDIRKILLVTSAVHMPRASLQFERAGIEVVPVPVPERARRSTWSERWLPTRSALWRSGRALKEYAGLLALRLGFADRLVARFA